MKGVLVEPEKPDRTQSHWRRNLYLVSGLLVVWFVVSYGCGILWVDALNEVQLGGFPLGFWFSQQGSILVFILLITVYCVVMDRLDARHRDKGDD